MPQEITQEGQERDWTNRVGYHPAEEGVGQLHDSFRKEFYTMGLRIIRQTRRSREQSLALTKLEEALMYVNKTIAIYESPLSDEWREVYERS